MTTLAYGPVPYRNGPCPTTATPRRLVDQLMSAGRWNRSTSVDQSTDYEGMAVYCLSGTWYYTGGETAEAKLLQSNVVVVVVEYILGW